MKKLLLSLVLLIGSTIVYSNAIPYSEAIITEVYFDENNNWTIEIYYEFFQPEIDSIYALTTSTDTAIFRKIPDETNFLILTADDLESDIEIDPEGDQLQIFFLFFGYYEVLTEKFSYGNYPGSTVNAPLPGQSVVGLVNPDRNNIHRPNYEVIDTSESIGFLRDPAKGILEGYVYDSNGFVMPYVRIRIKGFENRIVWADRNGYFRDSLYAQNHSLLVKVNDDSLFNQSISISPDSNTVQNIVLSVSSTVAVKGNCKLKGMSDHSGIYVIFMPECPFALIDTLITNSFGKYRGTINAGHYYIRYSHDRFFPEYSYIVSDIFADKNISEKVLEKGEANEIQDSVVKGRWEADLPYWIFRDIKIPAGDTLVIDPGVNIRFKGNYGMDVYGTILACGTEDDSIYFSDGIADTVDWKYLRFHDSTSSGSILDFVKISRNERGIHFINSSPLIKRSKITYNSGVYIKGNSSPYFTFNRFYKFTRIWCEGQSTPCFNKNVIIRTKYLDYSWSLVNCFDRSDPIFYYNIFLNYFYGISWLSDNHPEIIGNIFYNDDWSYALGVPYHYKVIEPIKYNLFDVFAIYSNPMIYPGFGKLTHYNINGTPCDVYCNIQWNPRFIDPENGNYHIHHYSPCIDAGDPHSPDDPDGTIADIGVFYYDQLNTSIQQYCSRENNIEISHYPNPVSEYVTFIIDVPMSTVIKTKITITDIKGNRISELPVTAINSSGYSITRTTQIQKIGITNPGTYLYFLEINGNINSGKMLVVP